MADLGRACAGRCGDAAVFGQASRVFCLCAELLRYHFWSGLKARSFFRKNT